MKTLRRFLPAQVFPAVALAVFVSVVILSGSWAQAVPLHLNEGPEPIYPDMFTSYICVTYTEADRHLVTTDGYPSQFTYPNPSNPEELLSPDVYGDWPGFLLDMYLDENNQPLPGGTVEFRGWIYDIGAESGTLLTGDIQQFGYDDVLHYDDDNNPYYSQRLEFVAATTGGDLKEDYFPTHVGVIIDWTGYAGTFDADFCSDTPPDYVDVAISDSVAVPEPSSVVLLVTSTGILLAMSLVRRLRRTRSGAV